MTPAAALEALLADLEIDWCRGECGSWKSHRRGFADRHAIHLSAKVANRVSLYRALHEVGHVVATRSRRREPLRWQREREAETYARATMRSLGFAVPRSCVEAGEAYVNRLKRTSERIRASQKASRAAHLKVS